MLIQCCRHLLRCSLTAPPSFFVVCCVAIVIAGRAELIVKCGGVEALLGAMRGHGGVAEVQRMASLALGHLAANHGESLSVAAAAAVCVVCDVDLWASCVFCLCVFVCCVYDFLGVLFVLFCLLRCFCLFLICFAIKI